MIEPLSIPNHIGFILDGNRRWARQHGLPAYEGHLAGYEALKDIVIETANRGVKYISLYTFSTENWQRAESEVSGLMKLMMRLFRTDLHLLIEQDLKLVVLGSRQGLPDKMVQAIEAAEAKTANCQKATIAVCFNYGGQQELINAVRRMIDAGLGSDEVDVSVLERYLYHAEVPACDLVVRTSGEQRLSNFMLWRSAYSELMFIDKLWPDMRPEDVTAILTEYNKRTRRYGG